MNMRRDNYIIICTTALLAALSSCSKSTVGGIDDTVVMPVTLGTNVGAVEVSKAEGASGALDGWNSNQVYVYGIETSTSEGPNISGGRFIDGVAATAPVSGTSGSLTLYNPDVTSGDEPFYYQGSRKYEFFGYYVDDAEVDTPQITSTSISIPIRIDGTQDVMTAATIHENDLAGAKEGAAVEESDIYSAYSARRDVHPNLVFRHQLSRFVFKARTGFADSDERAGKISVTGLVVKADTEATLTVVGEQGISGTLSNADLPLWRGSAGALQQISRENAVPITMTEDVLGDMMLYPGGKKYPITIFFHQDGYTVGDGYFSTSLELDFSNISFDVNSGQAKDTESVAGHQYTVTFTVWGLQGVDVNVSLDDWKPSGSFTINPDKD